MPSLLTPEQKYAAGALLGLALHQAQIHQTRPLGSSVDEDERISSGSSSDSVSDDPQLWVHENSGLLHPVFKHLNIENKAWTGLEETAGASSAQPHVGAFLRLISEESADSSADMKDTELALSKAIDVMELSMETTSETSMSKKEKHREYENKCREKYSPAEMQSKSEKADVPLQAQELKNNNELSIEQTPYGSSSKFNEKHVEEVAMLSYHRRVTVLYELLSGCLTDAPADNKKSTRKRNGYDARHRVALRLLATWLDIQWKKVHVYFFHEKAVDKTYRVTNTFKMKHVLEHDFERRASFWNHVPPAIKQCISMTLTLLKEAMEIMVACSVMALSKEQASKQEETQSPKSSWAKWKRGGIIGAAALTGGALMAITGGLAAPAIAAGFSALAPTLGTIIPVIGASGFAAAASAAGTVAGSVAIAASFGAAGAGLTGSKMARRTGSVDEFEFKAIGENHNQGRLAVEILVSGFVFQEEDFINPWEGQNNNLERYALQWESKNLIAVSTAIQDWLTSSIAMSMMKQGAMMTVLSTLVTALALPATLLAATDLIDSKWTIALDRSDKAGKLLAEVLQKGLQGNRPVTLIGYSLGARVIFKCLQYLAETEQNGELVERVVLLGAPISFRDENWEAARKMVAGRFVNAFSTTDWTLGVAFRASLLAKGLAGIQAVDVPGIENVDVTELIEGHSSYLWVTQDILDRLELDTYYPVFRASPPEPEK